MTASVLQRPGPDHLERLTILRSNDYDGIDLGSDFFAYHGNAKEELRRGGRIGRTLSRYSVASA